MKKFLYGKRSKLKNLIAGEGSIRFSDIIYYGRMENELMRDVETEKLFTLDKDSFHFEINGKRLDPRGMLANPVMTVRPPRAFCLCLSNKANAPELFERFKADICVEIDVDVLAEVLKAGVSVLPGTQVEHGPVTYYPPIMKGPAPDFLNALFCKPDIFWVEDEYRLALIIPPGEMLGTAGTTTIELYSDEEGQEQHMHIKGYRDEYLGQVYYR